MGAQECGVAWKKATPKCCENHICNGKFCSKVVEDCAPEGVKSPQCGSRKGKEKCCAGLVCHNSDWVCVKEENKLCAGDGRASTQCGSRWSKAASKCCTGLVCGASGGTCSKIKS